MLIPTILFFGIASIMAAPTPPKDKETTNSATIEPTNNAPESMRKIFNNWKDFKKLNFSN